MGTRPKPGIIGQRFADLVKWLVALAGYVVVPFIVVVAVARLLLQFRALRGADVVVVMPDGGFGHTITGPDVARRLFPGRRCVFLIFSEYKRHNGKTAAVWPNVYVIFLPLNFGLDIGRFSLRVGHTQWLKEQGAQLIGGLARLFAGQQVSYMYLLDLYARIPGLDDLKSRWEGWGDNLLWPLGYFRLQATTPASPARLPDARRKGIEQALARAGGGLARRCCLYLRQKDAASGEVTVSRRVGSPLEDYLPAVRFLNREGYQVLLTGDVALTSPLRHEFGGALVDARSLGVEKNIFDLYAATEADIFIGESGGGVWLPGVNGIPRLLLNAFPYGFGMPNSWVYYQVVRDEASHLVHYSTLFSEHAYDYELSGMTLHKNSAEEICRAVSHFLDDLMHPERPDPHAHLLSLFPDRAWIAQITNARLSPAFVELYE